MNSSLKLRAFIILVVLVAAGFIAYPPAEKIKLGLDLRGGMHLVMRVETQDALKAETDNNIDLLLRELEDEGIRNVQIERTDDVSFVATGIPADRAEELRDDVFDDFFQGSWDYSQRGGTWNFEMTAANRSEIEDLAVRQALETIRNRIDAFGVSEPIIHREGLSGNRIVIQLPGVDDPERVKRLIKSTAFLELRLVAEGTGQADTEQALIDYYGGTVPDTVEILPEEVRDNNDPNRRVVSKTFWAVERKRVITGRDLKTARSSTGEFGEPAVLFMLNRDGAKKFGDSTAANIGRGLAIVLDNKVVSAPVIRDRITDQGVIHGAFTNEEVTDLVTTLRSGALPAGLTNLEERTVGPSLGQDSIDQGKKAALMGFGFVVLLMLVVYKITGLNAVTALSLNIVLVFGALAMFGATLTLPGIAGIVLTIGMAVDANVLVFERIKEELKTGRTVKSAIAGGFDKALSSILDANITTLIAAIFLFMFGTGPIRGFAVTLSVGIIASIFTAVFISRWLFDLIYSRRQRVDAMSI